MDGDTDNYYILLFVEWRLMFRGMSMVGTDVYEAWVGQIKDVTDEAECFFDCFAHYRNPLIDFWTDLEIIQVIT